ncbi:MAG TPA: GatB/YqeY domain-containing protein [Candidatus Saccharimonadales bacterium]
MLKQRLEQDLKQALLGGDRERATIIRGLKSVILYAEVEKGNREEGLDDEVIIALFAKEAKKRQESADLYQKAGEADRAVAELHEKAVIEEYLPKQLTNEELTAIVEKAIAEVGVSGPQAMGQVIGKVKAEVAGQADGARIARLVKEKLQ